RSLVPNLFTVLNVFFGFLCIIHAMQGRYMLAGLYVVFSAVCDTLDGIMARLTRSASEFGVELDSLADIVSFGAAPSVLVYALFLKAHGPFGSLLAAFQLLFGALRLARFNVQLTGFHKDHFVGVPIPLAALTIVSFMFFFTPGTIAKDMQLQYAYMITIFVCSVLMISTIRYPVLPSISLRTLRRQPLLVPLLLLMIGFLVLTKGKALFPILAAIILSGVLRATVSAVLRCLPFTRVVPADSAGDSLPLDPESRRRCI
ncbi:MAG: CDP-diacylglycerol--serine O-phosphatidyltransferase, partial [Bacteroidota bacterium]|nr:CDP-diacylglycerol--serine O-phosphatidyltransferase [Bacteroidota bacterium]